MEDLFLNKLAKELPKFVQYLSVGFWVFFGSLIYSD